MPEEMVKSLEAALRDDVRHGTARFCPKKSEWMGWMAIIYPMKMVTHPISLSLYEYLHLYLYDRSTDRLSWSIRMIDDIDISCG